MLSYLPTEFKTFILSNKKFEIYFYDSEKIKRSKLFCRYNIRVFEKKKYYFLIITHGTIFAKPTPKRYAFHDFTVINSGQLVISPWTKLF